jgi:outer membrane lipoprotein SlyB
MKSKIAIAALAAAVSLPMVAAAPAQAQYYGQRDYYSGYDNGYRNVPNSRQYYGNARTYRGRDVNYYQDCRRSSGTTGLLAGGAGGALIGSALGGGTVGTLLGALGGGLLGKHLDKQHDSEQNYRNGC